MPSFLNRIKLAWDYFVKGRQRLPPVPLPPDFHYSPPDPFLMSFAEEMFRSHGAHAFREGSWIVVDGGKLFVRASWFLHQNDAEDFIIQTDVVCHTSAGLHIVESFGGFGTDEKSAKLDACEIFQASSFHALFVTLLGHACEHVECESWMIGGIPRLLTFGWATFRGQFPFDCWKPIDAAIQEQMESCPLPHGLHWVRYYYAFFPGGIPVVEVLVDNEPRPDLMSAAAEFPWPPSDVFYSARLFFTVQDSPPL